MTETTIERLGRHGSRIRDLRRWVKNRRDGEVVVDGRRLLTDIVRWDVPIEKLFLVPELVNQAEAAPWIAASKATFEIEDSVLSDIAPTRSPQGVLALVDEPKWPLWTAQRGLALWLDRVQDPGNLGAIVRSAAGLGAAAVLLSPDCADPFGAGAVRGSAGAVFRVPLERGVAADQAVARVRERSGEVWATGAGGRPLADWRPAEPSLILLGAEGAGLSKEARDQAEGEVTIPLTREIESLNVAVAAGILLHQARGL
jgi:TrmH family RNA methyltransferase